MFMQELLHLLVAKQELYKKKLSFDYEIHYSLGCIYFMVGIQVIMQLDYRPNQRMIEVFNHQQNLHHKVLVEKGSDWMLRDIHNSLRLCIDEYLSSKEANDGQQS